MLEWSLIRRPFLDLCHNLSSHPTFIKGDRIRSRVQPFTVQQGICGTPTRNGATFDTIVEPSSDHRYQTGSDLCCLWHMHPLSPIIANARCEPSLIRQSEPRHMHTLHSIRNFWETCARRRAGRRSRLTTSHGKEHTTIRPFSRGPLVNFATGNRGCVGTISVCVYAYKHGVLHQATKFFFCLSSLVRKSRCSVTRTYNRLTTFVSTSQGCRYFAVRLWALTDAVPHPNPSRVPLRALPLPTSVYHSSH